MANFPGVDYMEIDSLFSEDELMVRQTVRDFVDEEVIPIIEKANREEKFPMHLIPKMAEMGLFGSTISEYVERWSGAALSAASSDASQSSAVSPGVP